MAETLAPLTYGLVTGRFVLTIPDTTADVDDNPEVKGRTGTLTFEPLADEIILDALGTSVTLATTTVELLPSGWLPTVKLVTGPFQWRVTYNFTDGGKPKEAKTFTLPVNGVVNVATVNPTVTNPGTGNAYVAPVQSVNAKTGNVVLTSADLADMKERIQDEVAALLGAGSNVILNYDDTAGTLSVSATGAGGAGLDAEQVRDAIGVAMVGIGNIAVTVNDAADTITISTTATVNSTDAQLRDRATHTGTQPTSSISGLNTAIDARISAIVPAMIQAALDAYDPGGEPTPAPTAFVSGTTKPTASNTGVGGDGTTHTLTARAGDLVVTTSNQTYTDLDIAGRVIIGNGITGTKLSHCKIRGSGTYTSEVYMVDTDGGTNTTIEFCEIYCQSGWGGSNGVGAKNYTIRRSNIHHVTDGLRINRSGNASTQNPAAVIEDNYVHDLIVRTPDPLYSRTDNKTHSDCIEIEGCDSARIYGNNFAAYHSTDGSSNVNRVTISGSLLMPTTSTGTGTYPFSQANAAIMYADNTPPINNVTVEKNWFGGGEVTINHRDKGTGTIRNNRFDRGSFKSVPIFPATSTTFTISGNTYEDNGAAI